MHRACAGVLVSQRDADAVYVVLLADELLCGQHEPVEAHDDTECRRAADGEAPICT